MNEAKILEKKFNKNIFYKARDFIPFLEALFNYDACIAITDTDNFIYLMSGRNFKFPMELGAPICSRLRPVLNTKEPAVMDLSNQFIDHASRCYAFPLQENNEVVGLLIVCSNRQYVDKFHSIVGEMTKNIKNIDSKLENIEDLSENQSDALKNISSAVNGLTSTVKALNELSNKI